MPKTIKAVPSTVPAATSSRSRKPRAATRSQKGTMLKAMASDDYPVEIDRTPEEVVKALASPPKPVKKTKPTLSDEIKKYLKAHLKIQVERGDFVSPNDRKVKLMLDGECISSSTFCIRAQREYEG